MDEAGKKRLLEEYAANKRPETREQLILEYAPLVKAVAGRLSMYLGYNVDYEDLVSYGIFGLIDAIDKFDCLKEVKFETYASLRIRGAILDQIRKMDWIPRTIRQRQKKIDAVIKEVEQTTGRSATDEDIAAGLGISSEEYLDWQSQMKITGLISLNEYMDQGSDVSQDYSRHMTARFDGPEESVEKEDIAYYILLDCSGSIPREDFYAYKESITELSENIRENDALLVYTFGDDTVKLYNSREQNLDELSAVLETIENRNLEHLLLDIQVPMEEVIEEKDGKQKVSLKKKFPGYVLIKMLMTDESWYVVRNTRGVTGFVGPGSKPVPLTDEEVESMGVVEMPIDIDLEVGESVRVISGPLREFVAIIQEISVEKHKIKALIDMFGRETLAELDFNQVEKLV